MDSVQSDMNETLITLTSDIVAAHVSNNGVAVEELPVLISSVYGALAALGQAAPAPAAEPLKPAVSVRASVKPNKVVCLDCGTELQMLKRHLMTHHNMTPDEYKARWSLPVPDHRQELPEVNCRTCIHSTPTEDGGWICEQSKKALTVADQREGCHLHLWMPSLFPSLEYTHADESGDGTITAVHYTGPAGAVVNDHAGRMQPWF